MSVTDISTALQSNDDQSLENFLGGDNGNDFYAALKKYTVDESNAGYVQKLIESPAAQHLPPYKKIVEAAFREAVHARHDAIEENVLRILFNAVKSDKTELQIHLSYIFNEAVSSVGHEDAVRDRLNKNAMIAKMIVADGADLDGLAAGYEAGLAQQKQEIELKQQALQSIKNSFK